MSAGILYTLNVEAALSVPSGQSQSIARQSIETKGFL